MPQSLHYRAILRGRLVPLCEPYNVKFTTTTSLAKTTCQACQDKARRLAHLEQT